MLYKLKNDRRHKFKKIRYQIKNWPAYNEALKKRKLRQPKRKLIKTAIGYRDI